MKLEFNFNEEWDIINNDSEKHQNIATILTNMRNYCLGKRGCEKMLNEFKVNLAEIMSAVPIVQRAIDLSEIELERYNEYDILNDDKILLIGEKIKEKMIGKIFANEDESEVLMLVNETLPWIVPRAIPSKIKGIDFTIEVPFVVKRISQIKHLSVDSSVEYKSIESFFFNVYFDKKLNWHVVPVKKIHRINKQRYKEILSQVTNNFGRYTTDTYQDCKYGDIVEICMGDIIFEGKILAVDIKDGWLYCEKTDEENLTRLNISDIKTITKK